MNSAGNIFGDHTNTDYAALRGERQPMYFNPAQLEAMIVGAKNEYIVGGRGVGKSEGFDSRVLVRNMFAMPRSAGALLSPSYTKLKAQTFPAIARALDRWGYRENIHYFVGRKPPRDSNFSEPYIRPFEYKNVISFFNGSIVHMVSFDRPMSTNSMSLDYIIGPEARFLSYEKIVNDVSPAVRGNRQFFSDCPWHGGSFFSTDMPTTSLGSWILAKESEMDRGLILLIKTIYYKLQKVRAEGNVGKVRYWSARLAAARSRATFFGMYSSLSNIEILGEEWFAKQQRDLPPAVFNSSILNIRATKKGNAFYASFDEGRNTYEPKGTTYGEAQPFSREGAVADSRWDGDVNPDAPLLIANDYNASINTIVVGQLEGETLRVVNAFYVKSPDRLIDVVAKFTSYYAYQHNREVVFYYDSTAVSTSAASGDSFSDIVIRGLREAGFNAIPTYIGQPLRHHVKYEYINAGLKGEPNYVLPLFNSATCADLLEAIARTVVVVNRNGFAKDKSSERLPDTPEYPDEYKTHFTDAWDTLYIGANFYKYRGSEGVVSGFI